MDPVESETEDGDEDEYDFTQRKKAQKLPKKRAKGGESFISDSY